MAKQRLADFVAAIRAGNLDRTLIGYSGPARDAESTAKDVASASGSGASRGKDQKKSSDQLHDATAQTDAFDHEKNPVPWRQFLSERVWGHLPPSVRERMETISTETTLSQYRDLIRAYYESLAKTKRRFGEASPDPKSHRHR